MDKERRADQIVKKDVLAAHSLDIAVPIAWRRWLPTSLRALVWGDSSPRYDAFLSYSWKSDSKIAPLIQSVIQRFACPWYRVRARTVFRDLSSLPAGSSLEDALFDRIDRSTHLLVLSSPESVDSRGMELEAAYWFSRKRQGEVLIVVTAGQVRTFHDLSKQLPPSLRENLKKEPLWVPLQHRRAQILNQQAQPHVREELVEDLKQILLQLYPGRDWGDLRGEERAQRRRAIALLIGLATAALLLTLTAAGFAAYWYRQDKSAQSRELAARAEVLMERDQSGALDLAVRGWRTAKTDQAMLAVAHTYPLLLAKLIGHTDTVSHVDVSPDGTRIVTASSDKTARVWSAMSGRLLLVLSGHGDVVASAVFSPDGRHIVTASSDKTARVWNADNGRIDATLEGHTGAVWHTAFSPDGKRIVTTGEDHSARVWDRDTGRLITTLEGHADRIQCGEFSPDGQRILTAGEDGTARIWKSADGTLLAILAGQGLPPPKNYHQMPIVDLMLAEKASTIRDARFSKDGRRVVTASDDHTARIWDAGNGRLLAKLEGHTGVVGQAEFSPDGDHVITAGWDGSAILWDAGHGRILNKLQGHSASVLSATFSPDGNSILTASADHTARVWNARNGRLLARLIGHNQVVHHAVFSPTGQQIITSSFDGTARVWGLTNGQLLAQLDDYPDGIRPLGLNHYAEFSPDGEHILTASIANGEARTWRLADKRIVTRFAGDIGDAHFSPDGRRVLTTGTRKTIAIWDATGGKPLFRLEGDVGEFSPDGHQILTGSSDNNARLWNTAKGELVHIFRGHTNSVWRVQFSSDGKRVLTKSVDNTTRLWTTSGELLHKFEGLGGSIIHANFVPDGARVVTASGVDATRIWNAENGELVATLGDGIPDAASFGRSSEERLLSASFSPDGQRILSLGYDDDKARVWRVADGLLLFKLEIEPTSNARRNKPQFERAEYSPNGQFIITASGDSTVRIWSASNSNLVAVFHHHEGEIFSMQFSSDSHRLLTSAGDQATRVYRLLTISDIAEML